MCHLVVHLLKVLGWTPQKIALEHKRIDAALFTRLPREDKNLALVVEAKALHQACLGAFGQAKDYAETYPNCKLRATESSDRINRIDEVRFHEIGGKACEVIEIGFYRDGELAVDMRVGRVLGWRIFYRYRAHGYAAEGSPED